MLNRIRSVFGLQPRAPSNAAPPTGSFGIVDGRCRGTVSDHDHPETRPLTVTLENTAEQSVLTQASANAASGYGRYEFAFDLPAGFDPVGVLAGRVGVFAENAYALKGKLDLERASEISLIQAQQDPPRAVVFDLTFGKTGTAEPCLGTGWGGLEEAVCCTEGPHATLDVPAPTSPDAQYQLSIDCFAFLPEPHIVNQRMTITLNGFSQVVDVGPQDAGPITLIYPTRSLSASEAIHVEFDLPNCFRPIDYKLNEDVRQLSFAFRQLTFSRLLFSDSHSEPRSATE